MDHFIKPFALLALTSFFCLPIQSMQKELTQTAQTQQTSSTNVQSQQLSENHQRQIQSALVHNLQKYLPDNAEATRLRNNIARVEELCTIEEFKSAYWIVNERIWKRDEAELLRAIIKRHKLLYKKAFLLRDLEAIESRCLNLPDSKATSNWYSTKVGAAISCYNKTEKKCCREAAKEDRHYVRRGLIYLEKDIVYNEDNIKKAYLRIIDRYILKNKNGGSGQIVDLRGISQALLHRKETKMGQKSKTLPNQEETTDSTVCVVEGLMDFIEVQQDITSSPKQENKSIKAVNLHGGIATVLYVKKSNLKITNVDPTTGLKFETTYTPSVGNLYGPPKAPITHFAAITHFSASDHEIHEKCLQDTVKGAIMNGLEIMTFKSYMFVPENLLASEKRYPINRLTSAVKSIYPEAQIEIVPYKVVKSPWVAVTMERKWTDKNVDHIVLDYNLPQNADYIVLDYWDGPQRLEK